MVVDGGIEGCALEAFSTPVDFIPPALFCFALQ